MWDWCGTAATSCLQVIEIVAVSGIAMEPAGIESSRASTHFPRHHALLREMLCHLAGFTVPFDSALFRLVPVRTAGSWHHIGTLRAAAALAEHPSPPDDGECAADELALSSAVQGVGTRPMADGGRFLLAFKVIDGERSSRTLDWSEHCGTMERRARGPSPADSLSAARRLRRPGQLLRAVGTHTAGEGRAAGLSASAVSARSESDRGTPVKQHPP